MSPSPLRIAYLTAGAAGMYCGSCMHDNTLARALSRRGVDIQLIPAYTPILTDEENVSVDHVVFNGVKLYLQEKVPLLARLPAFVDRFLEQPWLLRWATSRGLETEARDLGPLTVSMLKGDHGHQRREVESLCRWLCESSPPQVIVLSNILIAGGIPELKRRTGARVLVTLQGDDLFLEELVEPHRSLALDEIRRLARDVDGFIVNSRYYADFMGAYLGFPAEKVHLTPLGIDTADFAPLLAAADAEIDGRPPTVGFLARLAPEKGLHVLVDAFLDLKKRRGMEKTQLRIAGWLGAQHRAYAQQQFARLDEAGLSGDYQYLGAVDRLQKLEFFERIDVFSAPTTYHEPKGLFVLEALAAGVPVVQPEHGAFPELLAATGGGRLTPPNDPHRLADELHQLLLDPAACRELGRQGQQAVHERFNADAMADAALLIYQRHVEGVAEQRPPTSAEMPSDPV